MLRTAIVFDDRVGSRTLFSLCKQFLSAPHSSILMQKRKEKKLSKKKKKKKIIMHP